MSEAAGEIGEREMLPVLIPKETSPNPIKEWLNYIMNNGIVPIDSMNYPSSPLSSSSSKSHTIHRVPQMLQRIEQPNEKCFEPFVVAIGPYHHEALKSAERFKIALTQTYIKNAIDPPQDKNPENRKEPTVSSIDEAFERVKSVAGDARKCYAEDPSIDDLDELDFAKMMFLDGCFVAQFIYSNVCNKPHELEIIMKSHEIAFVRRDLFLLENQLPYEVLRESMEIRFCEIETYNMIRTFITQTRASPPQEDSYVRKALRAIASSQKREVRAHAPAHLLDLMWNELIDKNAFSEVEKTQNANREENSYRSAHDLKNAGIHFRPSKTRRFADINYEFKLYRAFLKLPAIIIDDSAKSFLLNLVAFEMGLNGPGGLGVSSYLSFMDLLIDTEKDVKELRQNGIILNYLGSDEEVAKLFNEIAKNLVPIPHAYAGVKQRIERHYKKKIYMWVTDWINTHFSSPWTLLAFLGALLALGSSLVQTYYSAQNNDPKFIIVRA